MALSAAAALSSGTCDLADGSMAVLELNFPDNYYVQGRKKPRRWIDWLWPFD